MSDGSRRTKRSNNNEVFDQLLITVIIFTQKASSSARCLEQVSHGIAGGRTPGGGGIAGGRTPGGGSGGMIPGGARGGGGALNL